MEYLLRGQLDVNTSRKVQTETRQAGSTFQLRQFLESTTKNVHSISHENTVVCVSPPPDMHKYRQTYTPPIVYKEPPSYKYYDKTLLSRSATR